MKDKAISFHKIKMSVLRKLQRVQSKPKWGKTDEINVKLFKVNTIIIFGKLYRKM